MTHALSVDPIVEGPALWRHILPTCRPSGCWRPGDPNGRRQWHRLAEPLPLEFGGCLPDVHLAYETWGNLAPDGSNAILLLHALTGDSHAAGLPAPGHPTVGWWDSLIGPGRALDPDQFFLVAPNALGGCQGSTGPSSLAPDGRVWGSRFPALTIRDQVAAEVALTDALGISRWAAVIGGSMGGMRALEWACCEPDRVERLGLLACPAAATADQIAWSSAQLHAIRGDAGWLDGDYHAQPAGCGPHRGLATARRIAHITYRGSVEFDQRFGRRPQTGEDPLSGGRYAVESYLDYQAAKLVQRFDAGSYVVLTEAMNHHDVGRGRGGVDRALSRVTARTGIAGITSDRLFPLALQHELAAALPHCAAPRIIESFSGHDAFLSETEQIAEFLKDVLHQ